MRQLLAPWFLFTLLICPIVTIGAAQVSSPADLVNRLTQQPASPDPSAGVFTCGSANSATAAKRAIAAELASEGAPAIPAIEHALISIEKEGTASSYIDGAAWLLYSYAKIEGRGAYPRLRRIMLRPDLLIYQNGFSRSLAIALGLTSYVAASEFQVEVVCRAQEPTDTLDRFVLAWLSNDRPTIEKCLGPKAQASLNSLMDGGNWATLRNQYRPGRFSDHAAVGYRLDVTGHWAEPDYTLRANTPLDSARDPVDPAVPAIFTDSTGHECGREVLNFLSPTERKTFQPPFLIDNIDLRSMLRTLTSCATQGRNDP